jgi:hypothetical protein
VLNAVEREPFKAFGPNYGCDLGVVLGHCLRARRIERIRNLCLTVLLLGLLAVPGVLGDLGRVVGNPEALGLSLPWWLERHAGALLLAFGLAALVVLVETGFVRFRILAGELSKAGFARHDQPGADAAPWLPTDLARGRAHNLVVYGGFTPFVGAGATIGGWSFAIRTDKGRQDVKAGAGEPQPFVVADLYEHVCDQILELGLANLRIEPRVYVDGRAVRDVRRFLPAVVGQPRHHLEPAALQGLREESGGPARYYLCVEVTDWSGEIVLTIFLRFQRLPKSLFVEASYALLTPFRRSFYRVDEEDLAPRLGTLRDLLVHSALLTLWRWPLAPVRVAALVWRPIGAFFDRMTRGRAIRHNPGFNYGAEKSLREHAADQRYRVYFQRLDEEMHLKIVEQRLLDALIDFLDEHQIDTSSLKERETTILNNGVMSSGGSLRADTLAVGDKAQASSGRLQRAMRGGKAKKAA